ncbi:MAG: RNA polymerase sigma-54 factor, partial [Prevotellaceae bacterium]|nr:RNA polymerase sigma-54 factor [Prevotellaceae bacterium]
MQKLTQTQQQQQVQQQRLSQQQMLQVKLLEMPLTELEQNINAELDDNPALEEQRDDPDMMENNDAADDNADHDDDIYEEKTEREEREEALDNALESLGSDDELPSPESHIASANNPDADYEETVWGDTTSFYDKLKEQMGEIELTDTQRNIMEYLIGSLDNDGLLRKNLGDIADELAIYHNTDVPESEIETVLKRLQTFDPAGIGARNLQECLLLQIARKPAGPLRNMMEKVIKDHFDEFTKKHWGKIIQSMQLSPEQAEVIQKEIKKLNPKPGSSLGETQGRSLQQITPDFIVDTDDEGNVTFTISHGRIPDLKISPAFSEMVDTYRTNRANMNRQEKEALLNAR